MPQDITRKANILPHLQYCGPLLIGIGKRPAKRLEDTNYFILRTVLGLSKSISYDQILVGISLLSIEHWTTWDHHILEGYLS